MEEGKQREQQMYYHWDDEIAVIEGCVVNLYEDVMVAKGR